jgi:hypothetical protein
VRERERRGGRDEYRTTYEYMPTFVHTRTQTERERERPTCEERVRREERVTEKVQIEMHTGL